ncbi:SEL1-like repeat protein, partial [Salmonella enterica subsp. enterica serovar Weltevreden]|nr:SEL1-like repeat protein [Salmonella enterica subsp. enterica serovar Weltevreden]
YKDDKKQGADRRWSERTGKPVEEVMFANDERNGLKREFNDRTGKVLSALPYVDGDKEGTEEAYDEDGIKYIRCYHNDEELSELYAPTDVTNKAKQGDSTAQYHLGKYEFECTNYDAAMKWLTQSAEQNHPGALLFLAYAYNDGDGVAQDSKKYLSYLFKAAELGESYAQLEVGYLNLIGEGMPKNLPEAYKWIKKSADQGNAQAHYNLGLMYRNGDGVEKDLNKAKLHLTAAVKGGGKPALAALKELTPQTK